MKISKDTNRILEAPGYDDDNGNEIKGLEVIEADSIQKVWSLYEFYQVDEDYPDLSSRKYALRGPECFSNEFTGDVYEAIDYDAEQEALESEDDSFFCKDENFRKVDLEEYGCDYEQENWWDGSNWRARDLSVYTELTDEYEGFEIVEISSTYNGQGYGHDEVWEMINADGEHVMNLHRPVSYWQGERNNVYYTD